jgi:hypothetical protein
VVARRQDSTNVQAPPIFEQNAANALHHKLGEKDLRQGKKELTSDHRIHFDHYKSANSKTLLPGSL